MSDLQFVIRNLSVSDYQTLRNSTEWESFSDNTVEKALEKDLFSICVFDHEVPIGMGRVIGDGAIYFYVQDVIVLPKYQGIGVGNLIMNHIEEYLIQNTNKNSFIGLIAADGAKEFYYKYGYKERPDNKPGMSKTI